MADQEKKAAPKIRVKETGEKGGEKGEKVEKSRPSSKEPNNERPSSSKEPRPESSRKEREPSARKEQSGGERKTERSDRPVLTEPSAQKGGVRKESSRPSSGRPPVEEEAEEDDDDDDDEDLFGGGFDELGNYLLYQNENGDVLNVTEVLLLNKQSIDKQTEVLEKINKTLAGIAQGLKK